MKPEDTLTPEPNEPTSLQDSLDSDEDWDEDDLDPQFDNQEFASMLDQSDMSVSSIKMGAAIKAVVSSIPESGGHFFVDIGSKGVGMIEKREFMDEDQNLTVKVGDMVEANVVSKRNGEVVLSKVLSRKMESAHALENAFKNKIPVRGKVVKDNKGGFEVAIAGKKAFCPVSQIDLKFVEDKSEYMNNEYEFLITKLEGHNVVVSRSDLLKIDEAKKIQALTASITPNSIFTGEVVKILDFGAIVDLGGIQGMVHVSQLSYSHVTDVKEEVSIGDQVQVKVLSMEQVNGKHKIALSIKDAQEDPWETIDKYFKTGNSYKGKVTKLMDFGAFVELKPGLEGLIHVSEMSWEKKVNHPSEVVKEGDIVSITIKRIDYDKQKMSLSMKDVEDDPWYNVKSRYPVGSTHQGTVERLKNFGAIVALSPGLSGLVPISALRNAHGEAYRKKCCPPNEIEVSIIDIDMEAKKILLSLPDLKEGSEDQKDYEEYMKAQKKSAPKEKSMGNFGELLMEQFNKNK